MDDKKKQLLNKLRHWQSEALVAKKKLHKENCKN